MIQRHDARQPAVSERSPVLGVALLLAPTLCLVALRFSSTALEEVLSEDEILMYSMHGAALAIGLVMLLRYRKVEDHEYHRSQAIRKLSRTYSREDRGLWEKGDSAIEKLETRAKTPKKGRSALRAKTLEKGSIGSLNRERREEEIADDEPDSETRNQGVSTIVDEQAIKAQKGPGLISRISFWVSRSLDNSAKKRMERKAAKATNKPTKSSDMWATPKDSSLTRSVSSCPSCGALNNSGTSYCTSCGDLMS